MQSNWRSRWSASSSSCNGCSPAGSSSSSSPSSSSGTGQVYPTQGRGGRMTSQAGAMGVRKQHQMVGWIWLVALLLIVVYLWRR